MSQFLPIDRLSIDENFSLSGGSSCGRSVGKCIEQSSLSGARGAHYGNHLAGFHDSICIREDRKRSFRSTVFDGNIHSFPCKTVDDVVDEVSTGYSVEFKVFFIYGAIDCRVGVLHDRLRTALFRALISQ